MERKIWTANILAMNNKTNKTQSLERCKDFVNSVSVNFYQKLLQCSLRETNYITKENYASARALAQNDKDDKDKDGKTEEYKVIQKYFTVLDKLSKIMKNYFTLEFTELKEIIENIESSEVFDFTRKEENDEKIKFYTFFEEQMMALEDLLIIIKIFMNNFYSLTEQYRFLSISSNSENEESIFTSILADKEVCLSDFEKLIVYCDELIAKTNESEYLRNTIYQLILLVKADIITLKSLLVCYFSILGLESISSISNMLVAKKNLAIVKKKNSEIMEYKIYSFFTRLFIDNQSKYHLIFSHFLDAKKAYLTLQLSELQSSTLRKTASSSLSLGAKNSLIICEELFEKKKEKYSKYFMDKFAQEKIEVGYFVILFNLKYFHESNYFRGDKNSLLRFQFKSSNSSNTLFYESSDVFGVVSCIHVDAQFSIKNILTEIEANAKGFGDTKNFDKIKNSNNQHTLLATISPYLIVAVRYREKSGNDEASVAAILKNLKLKFINHHIFQLILEQKTPETKQLPLENGGKSSTNTK